MATSMIIGEHMVIDTTASDSSYVVAGTRLVRAGKTCSIQFNGLKDIPNGGFTEILTLPPSFATTTTQIIDKYASTSTTATTFTTLRFQISGNKLRVYNYGSAFTNGNWRESITYLL